MSTSIFPSNVFYATSTVADGNMAFSYGEHSEVLENRKNFFRKHGKDISDAVFMFTPHEDRVQIVTTQDRGKGTETNESALKCEALITKEKGLLLSLLTADCLPITFYDQKNEVIALAHLGWKPTEKKLVAKVIETLKKDFNSDPAGIAVSIGPAIHKESYAFENPEQKGRTEWKEFLTDLSDGKTSIDLIGFNKKLMLDGGIVEENIHINPNDTFTSPQYFSYMQQKAENIPRAAFVTVVGLLS